MLNRKVVTTALPYLLIRGRAENIPLLDKAVGLVIATPPYRWASRVSQKECCTKKAREYDALLCRVLEEATQAVKPGGYILLHASRSALRKVFGVLQIEFQVYQRHSGGSRRAAALVRTARFRTRFVRVKGFPWLALPVRLYRLLILRYSDPGDTVVHVFSGSANSAIAALELSRIPVLVDLHYHKTVRRRLDKRLKRVKAAWPSKR